MKALSIITSLYLLLFSCLSSASILHSVNVSSKEGSIGVFDSLTFNLNVGAIESSSGNIIQYEFSEADIGKSVIFNSGELFNTAVNFLTNGLDDELGYFLMTDNGGSGFIGTEFDFLYDGLGDKVDFFGETISAFELIINDAHFESPGRNPNNDGEWTDYEYNLTVNFFGATEVSSPSTIAIFFSIFVMLSFVRRNKNKLLN